MTGAGIPRELHEHPDRLRWNTRYESNEPSFAPHPLVAAALSAGLPDGPVLELACGPSGSALALAAEGRHVIAVDIADRALADLAREAGRRGLAGKIDCVVADVPSYAPGRERFALVLATLFWDTDAFRSACDAVRPGGLLAWEALVAPDGEELRYRVAHGDLSALLPDHFEVLAAELHASGRRRSSRLLARRNPADR